MRRLCDLLRDCVPTSKTKSSLVLVAALLSVSVALSALNSLGFHLPEIVIVTSRWLALAACVAYGVARRSLTVWIFIAMLVGAALGHDWPQAALNLRVVSMIFLRLIKTVIAPLLFGTLVGGIAGHATLKQVGRMGVKALIYFEVVTTLALVIGLAAINISKAGVGAKITAPAGETLPVQKVTATETILHVFPENIAKSVADGQVLQVVVFSILFGIGLAMVGEDRRRPMLQLIDSLAETMFKFTNLVMLLAPLGVGAAIAYTVASTGMGILGNLAKLIATLYVALAVFVGGVLLPIAWFVGIPIRRFIAAVAEPVSIAFGTASSEAALPAAMEQMEAFGVPREIAAFVLPTGYSFNLDGSTLYLSLASIFVAQAAGVPMSLGQQLLLVVTLMLTSKGVAGVSRAGLVILLGTVGSFGLPVEPVFVLLAVDQLMDMARTSVNVLGNCLATVVVAKWEGQYDPAVMPVTEQPVGL
jgi:proton glutamate symport protein